MKPKIMRLSKFYNENTKQPSQHTDKYKYIKEVYNEFLLQSFYLII